MKQKYENVDRRIETVVEEREKGGLNNINARGHWHMVHSKATFTLHSSSDPILNFSSHVAQIGVAEYSFCSFVLNKRRSDADVLLLKSRWVLVAAVVSDDGSCTDERFSPLRLDETTK